MMAIGAACLEHEPGIELAEGRLCDGEAANDARFLQAQARLAARPGDDHRLAREVALPRRNARRDPRAERRSHSDCLPSDADESREVKGALRPLGGRFADDRCGRCGSSLKRGAGHAVCEMLS